MGGGGGAAASDPSAILGDDLLYWCIGEDLGADASKISSWVPRGPDGANNLVQGTETNQPLVATGLGSYKGLQGDGTDDYMIVTLPRTISANGDFTIYFAVTPDGTATDDNNRGIGLGAHNKYMWSSYTVGGIFYIGSFIWGSGFGEQVSSPGQYTWDTSAPSLAEATAGGVYRIRYDGTNREQRYKVSGKDGTRDDAVSASGADITQLVVGSARLSEFGTDIFQAIVLTDTATSDEDDDALFDYLGGLVGLS